MLNLFFYVMLLILCLGAVGLNIVSLPGNWLVFIAAIGWSWAHGWTQPGVYVLAIMLLVLLGAEVLEFLGGMVGARKFGASKTASWMAILGAFIGAILGIYIPVPLVGSLIGAVLGAFATAWLVELLLQRPMGEATKAAVGAALGRGVGIFVKVGGGLLVWLALALLGGPWA
jgi:uncharacterized protein YqgC (DUF456 family)